MKKLRATAGSVQAGETRRAMILQQFNQNHAQSNETVTKKDIKKRPPSSFLLKLKQSPHLNDSLGVTTSVTGVNRPNEQETNTFHGSSIFTNVDTARNTTGGEIAVDTFKRAHERQANSFSPPRNVGNLHQSSLFEAPSNEKAINSSMASPEITAGVAKGSVGLFQHGQPVKTGSQLQQLHLSGCNSVELPFQPRQQDSIVDHKHMIVNALALTDQSVDIENARNDDRLDADQEVANITNSAFTMTLGSKQRKRPTEREYVNSVVMNDSQREDGMVIQPNHHDE